MHITLLATGKLKQGPLPTLCEDYIKRLRPHWPTTVIELSQSKANTPAQVKVQEAKAQQAKIPHGAFVVALDETGQSLTTRALASQLAQWQTHHSHLCFLIGGAEGLDETIKQRADLILSLSELTLPHQLARLLLLEQLYRCATVLAGHPYHRA
jgi:23S rRNA (pseudouridine1915-N3)-methyltransferase